MEFNDGYDPFPHQRADGHVDDTRPATATSIATSAASFRIPGIRPSAPDRVSQPNTLAEEDYPSTSFVRLFAPQADSGDTLWHARQQERNRPVPGWLREGPSPAAFIATSQDASVARYDPRSALHRDGCGWNPSPAAPGAISPWSWQSDDQVRPFTASSYHRSKLVTADGFVGNYVCALIENRGTGREVGIASIERDTGLCVITQLVDTPTYARTIHHLSMHPPRILLVPASPSKRGKAAGSNSTSRSSKKAKTHTRNDGDTEAGSSAGASQAHNQSVLVRILEQLYGVEAQPFPRSHWDHEEGARYLDRLVVDDADTAKQRGDGSAHAAPEEDAEPGHRSQRSTPAPPQTGQFSLDLNSKASSRAAIIVATADKFYLLSAFACLIDFYMETFNRVFTPKTLRIKFVVPEAIPHTTLSWSATRSILDPKTRFTRLLRMNVLQPLADLDVIVARQEAVAELRNSDERYYAVHESLKPLRDGSIDLDKLIHALSCPPKFKTDSRLETEKKLSSILSLRTLIRSLAPVRGALRNSSSQLLQSISSVKSDDIDEIHEAIHETIDDEIIHAKGGLGSRHAKMNAVRAARSPLLDVARQTYKENLEDIQHLQQRLESETGLKLSLMMISTGFLLKTSLERSEIRDLPDCFTNVTRARSGKSVTMTTLPLKKLNARLVDSMNEVCTMSETVIDELIKSITDLVASLNKVSEALSLLDMLVSFANVSIANDYVRPAIGDKIDIREARHPILDRKDINTAGSSSVAFRRRRAFVANDIYMAPGERVCLITGPNMSGKSTILRQIALITVLAGIGCFVPARQATVPIPDALLSLLTHEDDPTQNLSTFAVEMRTAAFIHSVASPRSLVLLDEMGRGTSPDEGCAVATAIVEDLLYEKGCTVFFATHFGELVDGFEGKEGVVCQHLNVGMVQRRENVDLVFHHKLHLGPGLNSHYSLQVAKMMGCFEDGFLQRAKAVAEASNRCMPTGPLCSTAERERRRLLRNTVRDLRQLADGSFADNNQSEGQEATHPNRDTLPLIAKLSVLQLNFLNKLEETFHE
ncbi:related to meiosis-specific MutS homolog [Sporisorium reilianum SRZ2]|uniref:Related to meiosis-specific MutS homolog n=1 Tax=Sporisorium reilianum (strain SRZ2) TaxID=999809 RepID=E6ZWD9_SPORE|nr:related to meiosis-specific MutS homolog [Sporisorium reilianum SRZ2]